MIDLEPIKERLANATPGPWKQRGMGVWTTIGCKILAVVGAPQLIPPLEASGKYDNALFVAHAPTDIAALLTELDAARAALEWYADPSNYNGYSAPGHDDGYRDWINDNGARARAALDADDRTKARE